MTDPKLHETGQKVKTPRGTFTETELTAAEMRENGYGTHHESDTHHIMGNGKIAFAVKKEAEPC